MLALAPGGVLSRQIVLLSVLSEKRRDGAQDDGTAPRVDPIRGREGSSVSVATNPQNLRSLPVSLHPKPDSG